jgi:hypothetical protein
MFLCAAGVPVDRADISALPALHIPAISSHTRVDDINVTQRADATVNYITQIISSNMIERECLELRDPENMPS